MDISTWSRIIQSDESGKAVERIFVDSGDLAAVQVPVKKPYDQYGDTRMMRRGRV